MSTRTFPKGRKVQKAKTGVEGLQQFRSGTTYFSYKGSLRKVYVRKDNPDVIYVKHGNRLLAVGKLSEGGK